MGEVGVAVASLVVQLLTGGCGFARGDVGGEKVKESVGGQCRLGNAAVGFCSVEHEVGVSTIGGGRNVPNRISFSRYE